MYRIYSGTSLPYSGKLSRRKLSWISKKWPILRRKLSRNAKTCHRWVWHAQISWRKLSQMALKSRNSWMFSPSKVFCYTVYYGHPQDHVKCPDWRGVLISEVVLQHFSSCMYIAWTTGSVLIREVSLIWRSLIERFHCRIIVFNTSRWCRACSTKLISGFAVCSVTDYTMCITI